MRKKQPKMKIPWGLIALGGLGVYLLSRKKPGAMSGLGEQGGSWVNPVGTGWHPLQYGGPAKAPEEDLSKAYQREVTTASAPAQPATGPSGGWEMSMQTGAPTMVRRTYTTVIQPTSTIYVPVPAAVPAAPPSWASSGGSIQAGAIAPYVSSAPAAASTDVKVEPPKEGSGLPWWLIPLGLAIVGQK